MSWLRAKLGLSNCQADGGRAALRRGVASGTRGASVSCVTSPLFVNTSSLPLLWRALAEASAPVVARDEVRTGGDAGRAARTMNDGRGAATGGVARDDAMRADARRRAAADPMAAQLRTRTQRQADSVSLPASVAQLYNATMAGLRRDRRAAETVEKMVFSPGFSALSEAEQTRLLHLVGGTNTQVSGPARAALAAMMADPAYANATPEVQAEKLRRFAAEQPGLEKAATNVAWNPRAAEATHSAGTPVKDFDFPSGKADAIRYDVTVDGRTIPVYLPADPSKASGYVPTIDEVTRALAAMPPETRALVNEVRVDSQANPGDAEWTRRRGSPRRAYMTAGHDGVLNIFPTDAAVSTHSMASSMIHEAGHFLAEAKMGPESDPRWEKWRAAMAADGIVPSVYARDSANEDLAEMLVFYEQVRNTPQEAELRRLFPARFALLDEWFGR